MMMSQLEQLTEFQEVLSELSRKLSLTPENHPTGTMAPLIRQRYSREGYSTEEKEFLNYFYTNTDKNVFGVIPGRMPDELWALLIGSYSRSELSLRDKHLKIFDEIGKARKKTEQEGRPLDLSQCLTLEKVVEAIRKGGVNLTPFIEISRKFLKKNAIGYGHSSLKDSDTVRFSAEGVSQLATKFLEAAVLAAYQEKSTRYVPFNSGSLILPPRLANSVLGLEVKSFLTDLMDRYTEATKKIAQFVADTVVVRTWFKTEGAYNNTVKAKTLDIARYFLPLAVETSLGMTVPTREMERHLSYLLSQTLEELQLIGYSLFREGLQLSPALLTHVSVNDYQRNRNQAMDNLARRLGLRQEPDFVTGRSNDAVVLVQTIDHPEDLLAASFLQESSNMRFEQILSKVRSMTAEDKGLIFDTYLKERGLHDGMGKAAELGLLVYDLVLDNGAFRDLARHRKGTILRQRFTPEHGFEWPEFLESEPSLISVKELYRRSVDESFDLWQRVTRDLPHEAQYLALMGHKEQYVYAADPGQIAYLIELRTGESGHESYRTIAQEMFRQLELVMPTFAKYIKVNLDIGTDRRRAEERTQERLRNSAP